MKKEGKNGIYLALIMVAWNMLLLITACGEKAPVTAGSSMTLPIDKQMD